eukprot:3491411-Rhodomonas_salina.1
MTGSSSAICSAPRSGSTVKIPTEPIIDLVDAGLWTLDLDSGSESSLRRRLALKETPRSHTALLASALHTHALHTVHSAHPAHTTPCTPCTHPHTVTLHTQAADWERAPGAGGRGRGSRRGRSRLKRGTRCHVRCCGPPPAPPAVPRPRTPTPAACQSPGPTLR